MGPTPDRILIIENDPTISDLIGRQALQSIGYQVQIVQDAARAIPQVLKHQPVAVFVDLNLPGLSGKDLLVALNSQHIAIPAIVIARKGMEADVIQAFRLGAADYVLWPVRDAEVVAVVERVLRQMRERRERESLARQLQQTNQELQGRVREMTALLATARAITPLADPHTLYERIMDGVMRSLEADLGWLMMAAQPGKELLFVVGRKLPEEIAELAGQAWDDGVSQVAAVSGESLSMYGEALKHLPVAGLGQAILAVPIKIQKRVAGILVAMRQAPQPFSLDEQKQLEAIAGYAALALVNLRGFRSLEDRARLLQQSADTAQAQAKERSETLQRIVHELQQPLEVIRSSLDILIEGKKGKLPTDQRQIVVAAYDKIRQMSEIVERAENANAPLAKNLTVFNLNNLVRQALTRFHRLALQNGQTLASSLCPEPVYVWADSAQVSQALDTLLTSAIQSNPRGGKISLSTGREAGDQVRLTLSDTRPLDAQQAKRLFDRLPSRQRPAGAAANLPLVKELITASGGAVWAESKPGQGTSIHLTLLSPREKTHLT